MVKPLITRKDSKMYTNFKNKVTSAIHEEDESMFSKETNKNK